MYSTFFRKKTSVIYWFLAGSIIFPIVAICSIILFIILVYDSALIALVPIFVAAFLLFLSVQSIVFCVAGFKAKKQIKSLLETENQAKLSEIVLSGKGPSLESRYKYIFSIFALVDLRSSMVYSTLLGHYESYRRRNRRIPKLLAEALRLYTGEYNNDNYKAVVESQIKQALQ